MANFRFLVNEPLNIESRSVRICLVKVRACEQRHMPGTLPPPCPILSSWGRIHPLPVEIAGLQFRHPTSRAAQIAALQF